MKISTQFNNIKGVGIGEVIRENHKTVVAKFYNVPGEPIRKIRKEKCEPILSAPF